MSRDTHFEFSNTRLNKAGKKVRDGLDEDEEAKVIENWRASHNHILNTWQSNLRTRIKGSDITLAQRLKRRVTIFDKLKREPTMALSNMHDIAGCRLIFPDIKSLEKYRKDLHEKKRFTHIRYKAEEDSYNYLKTPRDSGYRGVHDVYICKFRDKSGEPWNGLKVEIQYRTTNQHAWATAVEIAGSITGNHSKFDKGSIDQKEFFKLSSEIIARAHENMTSCYASLDNKELIEKFKKIEEKIHLLRHLKTLRVVSISMPIEGQTLILRSFPDEEGQYSTEIHSYDSLPIATKAYFDLEKAAQENEDVVLVRAGSNDSIKNAYRNYFSDADDFVKLVEAGIKSLK